MLLCTANKWVDMRLLLVEDDVMVASGIKLGLTDAGYAVDWVGSGERAEEVLREEGDEGGPEQDEEGPGGGEDATRGDGGDGGVHGAETEGATVLLAVATGRRADSAVRRERRTPQGRSTTSWERSC